MVKSRNPKKTVSIVIVAILFGTAVMLFIPTNVEGEETLCKTLDEIGSYNMGICDVAWKPDGSYALILMGDEGVWTCDGLNVTHLTDSYTGKAIAWKPDGSYILFIDNQDIIKYDGTTFQRIKTYSSDSAPLDVAWKPDGSYALILVDNATREYGGVLEKYDGNNFTTVIENESGFDEATTYGATTLCWRPSGDYALICTNSPWGKIWKFNGTNLTKIYEEESGRYYSGIAWKPDGSYALIIGAIIGTTGTILKYDGNSFIDLTPDNFPGSKDVAWKPDGSYALIPSDSSAKILKYDGNNFITLYSSASDSDSISWKNDGSCALIVGDWGSIVKYRTLVATLTGDEDPINMGESITFIGSFLSDTTGTTVQCFFDYGDGNNSGWISDSNITYTYENDGIFNAKLKVKNTVGIESDWSEEMSITVKPLASLTTNLTKVHVNHYVTFSGINSNGHILQYFFDFGDGSNSGWISNQETIHKYSDIGNYSAKLKVKNNLGTESEWSDDVTISAENLKPIANFTYLPSNPTRSDNVYFNDTSIDLDGSVHSWYWEIWYKTITSAPDTTSTQQNPTFKFDYGGNYYIRLTVTDNDGRASEFCQRVITIVNIPPTADAGTDQTVTVGKTVFFNGKGSDSDSTESPLVNPIAKYQWDFDGDGNYDWNSTTDGYTTQTYYKAGTYHATLRVTDRDGATATDTVTITVKEKGKSNGGGIPGFEPAAFLIAMIGVCIILLRKRKVL